MPSKRKTPAQMREDRWKDPVDKAIQRGVDWVSGKSKREEKERKETKKKSDKKKDQKERRESGRAAGLMKQGKHDEFEQTWTVLKGEDFGHLTGKPHGVRVTKDGVKRTEKAKERSRKKSK